MDPKIPFPETPAELERSVAQFARAFLEDPHAEESSLEGSRSSRTSDAKKKEAQNSGAAPVRYEGALVVWLTPQQPSEKPFILLVGPMGAGKTTALLEAEARLAQVALEQPHAPLPWRFRASDLASESLDP